MPTRTGRKRWGWSTLAPGSLEVPPIWGRASLVSCELARFGEMGRGKGVGGSVGRETGPGDCAGVYWHRWVGKEWPRKEPEENRDMRTQEREVSGAGGRAVSGGGGVAWAPASEKLSSLKTTPHPGCVPRAHQWP